MMEKYPNHPLRGATDLDSAMNLLWGFYKKHFVALYVISVVTALLSNLITSQINTAAMQSTTDVTEQLMLIKKALPFYLLLIFVALTLTIFIHAYILDRPGDEKYSLMTSLKKSAAVLFPYLAAAIVMMVVGVVAVVAGTILLILPGIFAAFYLMTVYLFSIPAALVETRNPMEIISRSVRLTGRNFWPNMGWAAVTVMVVLVISILVAVITVLPFTGELVNSLTDPSAAQELAKNPLYIIISALAGSLVTPLFPIMGFILYFRNVETEEQSVVSQKESEERVRVEDLYPKMPENDEQKEIN